MKQKFGDLYTPKIQAFLKEVGEANPVGIPEIHLPLWGSNYESSHHRILFVGQDTRGWGEMAEFQKAVEENLQEALNRHGKVFSELEFTEWTNNFGTAFWDTVMQFLALFHNIPDWKSIKRRERDDILQSFVWAQTNSVELWSSTPSQRGADFEAWRKFKTASERHVDSFPTLLEIFHPQIVIVMNWGGAGRLLGTSSGMAENWRPC